MSRRTLATTALVAAAPLGSAGVASAVSPPRSHARILAHFDLAAGQQPEHILVNKQLVENYFNGLHKRHDASVSYRYTARNVVQHDQTLRDGRIVEHWDAHQDVPATAVNPNTMF